MFILKKYLNLFLIFCVCSAAVPVFAFTEKEKTEVLKILKKYNNAAAVQMETLRTEAKKTLGTTKTSEVQILYSKNKINFLTVKPTRVEIIYNKSVWVIEEPDLELDENAGRKVTIFEASKASFVKAMAEIFSSPSSFLTKDTVIKTEGDDLILDINKFKSHSLKEVKITLDKSTKLIKKILIVDDIDTQTTIVFEKTEFLKSVPKNKFTYKKLKKDEILKP